MSEFGSDQPTAMPWMADGVKVINAMTGSVLAICGDRWTHKRLGEALANARLMSAAPDMAHLLSAVLFLLNKNKDSLGPADEMFRLEIKRALKKAGKI